MWLGRVSVAARIAGVQRMVRGWNQVMAWAAMIAAINCCFISRLLFPPDTGAIYLVEASATNQTNLKKKKKKKLPQCISICCRMQAFRHVRFCR